MQKIIFSLVMAVLMCSSYSYADVFVITDKAGDIYTISDKDDTVVPKGYSKSVIKDKKVKDLGLVHSASVYDYKNGSLKLSNSKLQEKVKREEALALEEAKKSEYKAKVREKLKTQLSLTDEELNVLLGVE